MRSLRGSNAGAVIARLNPIIRGWAAYYRGVVSSKTLRRAGPLRVVAHLQVGHTHATPNKPKKWIVRRYFGRFNKFRNDRWVFGDRDHVVNDRGDVASPDQVLLDDHRPAPAGHRPASPDDPDLTDYWAARRRRFKPPLDSYNLRLLARQDGPLPALRGPPAHRRPATAVPARMGTLVAERRPQGDRRRLPHPPRARRHAGREPNPPRYTPPATQPPGPHNAGARSTDHPQRPRGLLEPCAGKARTHGSEGAPAQQCAGATRHREAREGRDGRSGRGCRRSAVALEPGSRRRSGRGRRVRRRRGRRRLQVRVGDDGQQPEQRGLRRRGRVQGRPAHVGR